MQMRRGISIVLAGAVLAAGGASARAALIACDGFDYDPAGGCLSGCCGGGSAGFSAAWGASDGGGRPELFLLAGGSLAETTGELVTCGNCAASDGSHSPNIYIVRSLAGTIGQAGTTRYLSFLLRPEGTLGEGMYGGFFGLELMGSAGWLFVGKPGSSAAAPYALEGLGGTGQCPSMVTPVVGQAVLLVVRAEFAAGADSFRLYVDPDPCAAEPATPDAVKADRDIGLVSGLRIDGSGAFCIDEIRIGETYADVVPIPEPATLAVLALGGLAMIRRRRLTVTRSVVEYWRAR
jgi:hypothetical protein